MYKIRNRVITIALMLGITAAGIVFAQTSPDAVTSASITSDPAAFAKALSPGGTWIAAALNDITVKGDLIVAGSFLQDGKPYRKIALYSQDANRKVTASFTLTAARLIVRSEHTRIQNGTFVGDVIVESRDFELTNATVRGNVYFASDALMKTFIKDAGSKVTGTVGVKK